MLCKLVPDRKGSPRRLLTFWTLVGAIFPLLTRPWQQGMPLQIRRIRPISPLDRSPPTLLIGTALTLGRQQCRLTALTTIPSKAGNMIGPPRTAVQTKGHSAYSNEPWRYGASDGGDLLSAGDAKAVGGSVYEYDAYCSGGVGSSG